MLIRNPGWATHASRRIRPAGHSDPITGHRRTEVAAIDAISFHRVADNFEPYAVERELVKAAAGFWADPSEPAPAAIATGTRPCTFPAAAAVEERGRVGPM